MAPTMAEIERNQETQAFIPKTRTLTPQDTFDYEEPVQTQTQDEPDYTASGNNSSYYQSVTTTETTVIYTTASLVTITVSEVATVASTTIALITSESTITTLPPTEAPLISSPPAPIILSPGQIAGAVLGAITGLLLLMLFVYLLLTRRKWMARMAQLRLEKHEKVHRKKTRRRSKRTGISADAPAQMPVNRPAGSVRAVRTRPLSMRMTPEQRQQGANERVRAEKSEGRHSRGTANRDRGGNRRRPE